MDWDIGESLMNQAIAYGNLGNVYQTRGDLDRAIEYYEKSLAIDTELGHKQGMAGDYGNLGNVYQIRGDLDRACSSLRQAKSLFQSIGAAHMAAKVQGLLDQLEGHCTLNRNISKKLTSDTSISFLQGCSA